MTTEQEKKRIKELDINDTGKIEIKEKREF